MNNKHVEDVKRIWAWAFDQVHDPTVKHLILEQYIKDLSYFDPHSAEELSIFIYLQTPKPTTFGDQMTISYEQTQTRI